MWYINDLSGHLDPHVGLCHLQLTKILSVMFGYPLHIPASQRNSQNQGYWKHSKIPCSEEFWSSMKRETCQLHYCNCNSFYPMLFIFSAPFSIPFSCRRPYSFPTQSESPNFQPLLPVQAQPVRISTSIPINLFYPAPNNWLIHPISFPLMTAMYRSPPNTWGIMFCPDNPHLPKLPNFIIQGTLHSQSMRNQNFTKKGLGFFP